MMTNSFVPTAKAPRASANSANRMVTPWGRREAAVPFRSALT
jgi:hypothetical protein